MQTEKMYEQYEKLWKMIIALETKTDGVESIDIRLQVWKEINYLVNTNHTKFTAVISVNEVINFLNEILVKSEDIMETVLQEDIRALQEILLIAQVLPGILAAVMNY